MEEFLASFSSFSIANEKPACETGSHLAPLMTTLMTAVVGNERQHQGGLRPSISAPDERASTRTAGVTSRFPLLVVSFIFSLVTCRTPAHLSLAPMHEPSPAVVPRRDE